MIQADIGDIGVWFQTTEITAIKQVTWIFWLFSVYKSYVYSKL